jgi:hypothetical protein
MTDTHPARIAWIEEGLLGAGEHLPPPLRRRIVDAGDDAVPTLVSILIDEELGDVDGPGEGFAPIYAAALLGELRASAAIEPLLDVLADSEDLDLLCDRALLALRQMGAPAVAPTLARYSATEREDVRLRFASVLGALGVRDDAIFTLLVDRVAIDPAGAAMDLAEYGDDRALPYLSRAFDELPLDDVGGAFANQAMVEVEQAIEDLGGELTDSPARQGGARRRTEAGVAPAAPDRGRERGGAEAAGPQRPVLVRQRREVQEVLPREGRSGAAEVARISR